MPEAPAEVLEALTLLEVARDFRADLRRSCESGQRRIKQKVETKNAPSMSL